MTKAPAPAAGRESDDDLLARARKDFERCREAWADNQAEAKDDLRFARLGEQWPEKVRRAREVDGRPCLTFNRMPAFIRQVVNDARQNKPRIKVHPQDSGADPRVAEIINGLIRNIETSSDADVAYDTAIEHAVGQGFGFWKINTRYACDDAFEQDIVIERVANPFAILGDPNSTAADSSDWNVAFEVEAITRDAFEAEYPHAEKTDWDHDFAACPDWLDGDHVVVASWWTRAKVRRQIVALSDGSVVALEDFRRRTADYDAAGVTMIGLPREVESHKVTQRIMSGAEILRTVEWAGRTIPIVPVYGDEVIDENGKRHFRSLIHDAKSAQQMFNYWRTTTTELVALAPKAPWIGEEGAFDVDPNWETANVDSHSKLEYRKGAPPPQRQPFSGVPAGALQEALNAADDMKAIIGMYDASLGARSNETSGRAIMARQREGDVSTFHFIDNLTRAIRCSGRIILDLIPKVYTTERIVRVLGEDLKAQNVRIAPTGQPVTDPGSSPGQGGLEGAAVGRVYDITVGKYDLTVSAGPSYTTHREEIREMMVEASARGGPDVAAVMLPRIARLLDLPDAEELAGELQARLNPQPAGTGALPPEVQQGLQRLQALEGENEALKADAQGKAEERQIKLLELQVKREEIQVKAVEAQAKLLAAQQPIGMAVGV